MNKEKLKHHKSTLSQYDFKVCLDQKESLQPPQLAYAGEALSCATVFKWFTEFHKGQSSLLNDEYTGWPLSTVNPEKVLAIQGMLFDDNRCIYQVIRKELNIGSNATHKIIHKELYMKKLVHRWAAHDLTEY